MRKLTVSAARGLYRALPIMLGYVPIGAAYGLLSQQAGCGVWTTLGMSVFVFAGAAQFMAISMIVNNASPAAIISSTFVVNFRHVLMAASLSPFVLPWKKWQRAALGCMLTDESFVMHSRHFGDGDTDSAAAIALNAAAYVTWAAASVAGFYIGSLTGDPGKYGLDFALPGMFIGLLIPLCRDNASAVSAAVGGFSALVLHTAGAGNWSTFLGAVAGASAGLAFVKDS
ncbi:MAG: AzlC family ABC transporter permease [Synergistaceae bacterium]|nr:AzlC family ABC transporter permease [Synergistaceae bacterium]